MIAGKNKLPTFYIKGLILFFILLIPFKVIISQKPDLCDSDYQTKGKKNFSKALTAYDKRRYTEAIQLLNKVLDSYPDHLDAWHLLGTIYLSDRKFNLLGVEKCFSNIIEICPEYDPYAYFHLARIYFGREEYEKALNHIDVFLLDIDHIKSDEDYYEAIRIQDYATFYLEMMNNPVPFNPFSVKGVSSPFDEYLAILSPDNQTMLYTRKVKIPPRLDDLTPKIRYEEQFFYSEKNENLFGDGMKMPYPFNQKNDEGSASLTLDNTTLFFTFCIYNQKEKYYNCDICWTRKLMGYWGEVEALGDQVNSILDWDAQPSVSSDGKTLYFVSDRPGGFGGYDIYVTHKVNGKWMPAENLGAPINTAGNEKSPFIHTDNRTLYYSSDGLMGMGGYDIFVARKNGEDQWKDPVNIGYPINSKDDDVGFFVSVDGEFGYFASNKLDGNGGWDIYSFELYEEARPEEILVIKGKVKDTSGDQLKEVKVELKNIGTRDITNIEVDSLTGHYSYVETIKDDYLLTIKRKGFVNELKYISKDHYEISQTIDLEMEPRPIELGHSYRLNDVYFEFNSHVLTNESIFVVEEYVGFLKENPGLKIDIQGHTDNIGGEEDNLFLSERRAATVYDYLISSGIPEQRISYRGFGESRPIADNSTEEGRALNRRTEFMIMDIE